MKKILTYSAIAMMGLATLTGCKKSSSSPSYSMTASIGGTSFSAEHSVASPSGGLTDIQGWSGTSSTAVAPYIGLYLTGYNKTTGTFPCGNITATNYIVYYKNSTTNATASTTGTITITSASSSSIVGTFSCTTDDGTVITNGQFTAQGY